MRILDRITIYYLIIAFLILLYILAIPQFGLKSILWQFLPPVLATTVAGILLDYLKLKRWSKPITPVITGLIIGLTAEFGAGAVTLSLIGILAMAIKFFVRFSGKHIFNPAGAGLFAGMIFLSSYPAWWGGGGNTWIFLIWIPILLYKLKRWAPVAGFILPLIIASGFGILTSTSLLFFISVMLIEPKTSPYAINSGLIYGAVVGTGYLLFSQTNIDPFIPSLLIGNLGGRLLEKILV